MKQNQCFIDSKCPNFVCKLLKFLYGLKQAPIAWNSKFKGILPSFGFTISQYSLYIIILLLYVDDIILTGFNIFKVQMIITA